MLHKNYYTFIFLLLLIINFFFHSKISAQNARQVCKEVDKIITLLEEAHYKPIPIDDEFSKKLFRDFLEKLDKRTIYFTDASLKDLYKHQTKLDDYIQSKNCDFLKDFINYHKTRLENAENIINKLALEKLDFTVKDSLIFFHTENLEDMFSDNETDLTKAWQKKIKYEVLSQIYQEEDISSENWSLEIVREKEEESRKKITDKAKCKIQKILNTPYGYENHIKSLFINTLTNLFDPHTTYFTKEELNSFTDLLSKENLGLGIQLSENEQEEVIIEQLQPGE